MFSNVGHPLNVAQLLPRIQDWNDQLTVEAVESEILRTARVVEPRIGKVYMTEGTAGLLWRAQE